MEVSITMSEEEYNFIRAYAEEKRLACPNFLSCPRLNKLKPKKICAFTKNQRQCMTLIL